MTAVPKRKYTLEEYFQLDKNAQENFECFDGENFEMSGVSPEHWLQSDYLAGESFHINTLDLNLTVDEIYQGVEIKTQIRDPHNFR